ncbi:MULTISPECIES: hypothetical protein [unclassified Sporosarcina]|uniref:hypothetical protein n=1 Tax=unclassified Sporosarcina TaxID=2647733 RepID=UPI00208C6512|nr:MULTISPECIES: hypothetical protein [unclassified Sporosarcina]GKV65130.1 hypothetical protein NCCP2331_12830 [Sporosarcina sp. NCCP-2331]GLB55254.1 hypothetical protein NCCP2378_10400 [Sporosarcina sp. NCCP-2378]
MSNPLLFIGPIISDPSELMAKIGSFIPLTAPAVWIMRLSFLEEWPWLEISIRTAILFAAIWLTMKAAGIVFKVGILMYGKMPHRRKFGSGCGYKICGACVPN